MKMHYFGCLALVVFCYGCGKAERQEAVGFCKLLKQQQAAFTSANGMESDLFASAKAWTAAIATSGSGRGDELDRNAGIARDLAKSAAMVSAQLGQVRQAVYDQQLREEYPQSIRTGLIGQFTKRQRMLQDLRVMLEDAAKGFGEFKQTAGYKGDSYPDSISRLNVVANNYKGPDDAVATAVTDLKARYGIKDADLGG